MEGGGGGADLGEGVGEVGAVALEARDEAEHAAAQRLLHLAAAVDNK